MNTVKRIIRQFISHSPKKAFYAVVRCSDCNEEVKIRINRSSDFQVEYNRDNPQHCYTIKKEIIGRNCFNLMGLDLALTKDIKVLFVDVKKCEFVEFGRE